MLIVIDSQKWVCEKQFIWQPSTYATLFAG